MTYLCVTAPARDLSHQTQRAPSRVTADKKQAEQSISFIAQTAAENDSLTYGTPAAARDNAFRKRSKDFPFNNLKIIGYPHSGSDVSESSYPMKDMLGRGETNTLKVLVYPKILN